MASETGKRKLEADEAASSGSSYPLVAASSSSSSAVKAAKGGPILVVLPGAGGVIGKNMVEMLSLLQQEHGFKIVYAPKLSWNKFSAASKTNVLGVKELVNQCEGREFYIMGCSFGNRVLAELLAADLANKLKSPPSPPVLERCKGVIFCAYPLYGDKNGTDRLNQLNKVPRETPLCIISGLKDEYLNRDYLPKKGAELMKDVTRSFTNAQLNLIENGKHDLPGATGNKASIQKSKDECLAILLKFCK